MSERPVWETHPSEHVAAIRTVCDMDNINHLMVGFDMAYARAFAWEVAATGEHVIRISGSRVTVSDE